MFALPARRDVGKLSLLVMVAVSSSDQRTGLARETIREAGGASRAYGIWRPAVPGECDKTIHDRYSVLGPDGRLYPTWHPPVDPSGCSFGHTHGQNPRGAALFSSVGALPFGYANEVVAATEPTLAEPDDHEGHLVVWENGVSLPESGKVRCDILMKLHGGARRGGEYLASLRELTYHARCDDDTEVHVTLMSAIGQEPSFDARFALHSPSRYHGILIASLAGHPLGKWGETAFHSRHPASGPARAAVAVRYTDAFGGSAREEAFQGSIRQVMATLPEGSR